MILFEQDWARYPSADINMQTTNKSFVRIAKIYEKMGIKNHAFPLALINQSLKGIDPFDPQLTQAEILAITFECVENPWFYFREIARVPAQAGAPAIPLNANRANISLYWCFFNHVQYLLIQPRQTGKSLSVDELTTLLMNIIGRNSKINMMTKDDNLRSKNIQRLKEIRAELPYYFQFKHPEDTNNTEEITVKTHNNFFNAHVPQSSEKGALNKGRGLTTETVLIDEPPFQKYIDLAIPAMLAGMGAVRERAASVGAPFGVIMTTTAGQKDGREGKWVYDKLVMGSAEWSERFLDAKNITELEHLVRTNCPGRRFQIIGNWDHRQLGYTDDWLRRKMEDAMQDGQDAERDYLNVWTSGTAASPFDRETTKLLADNKRSPDHQEIFTDGYILSWFIPEDQIAHRMATSQFTIGMDTSDALGGKDDDIGMVLTDVVTAEVIAGVCVNETNLIMFSRWLALFMIKYKNILLIPEMRSSARAIVDNLFIMLHEAGEDPFKRIFNWIVNDHMDGPEEQERYRAIRVPMARRDHYFYAQYKRYFGFSTSGSGRQARTELYGSTLQRAAKTTGERVRYPKLVNQLLGLVNKNGRIDHDEGGHDDLVIAWLLGHWLLYNGKNLDHYGIDSRTALMDVGMKKIETREQAIQRSEQLELRGEIEALFEKLASEDDEFAAMRYEQQLRALDRRLILEDGDTYTLSELLRSARESRRGKARRLGIENDYVPAGRQQPTAGRYGDMAADPMYQGQVYNQWG